MTQSTSEPVLHELIANARIYDLGQCFWNGMPVHPFDPPYQYFLFDYHEHVVKDLGKIEPGFSHAIGMLMTSMHAGTHFDAPIHMSQDLKVQGIDITPYQRGTGFVDLPAPLHAMEDVSEVVGPLYAESDDALVFSITGGREVSYQAMDQLQQELIHDLPR